MKTESSAIIALLSRENITSTDVREFASSRAPFWFAEILKFLRTEQIIVRQNRNALAALITLVRAADEAEIVAFADWLLLKLKDPSESRVHERAAAGALLAMDSLLKAPRLDASRSSLIQELLAKV